MEKHRTLVNKYILEKRFQELLNYCEIHLKTEPTNYKLLTAYGIAYTGIEKFDDAITQLSKAIEIDCNYIYAITKRAEIYYETDQHQLAINDYRLLETLDAENSNYFYLGVCYYCLNNFETAINYFTLELSIEEYPLTYILRAECYKYLDEIKKANEDYCKSLLLEINDGTILELEKLNIIPVKSKNNNNQGGINFEFSFDSLEFKEVTFLEKRKGIYILKFNNNEHYVGQTINLEVRIKQHYETYNDISKVYFKSILELDLIEEESKVISILEKNSIRLRNLKQIKFLNIFDEQCQLTWQNKINFNYISGDKYKNETIRGKYIDRFEQLKSKPYFPNIIKFLTQYIKIGIPNYIATEYNYWTISCLPKHLLKDKCLSRINIHEIPVLSIYYNEDNSLYIMLFASKLPFLKYLKSNQNLDDIFNLIPSLKIEIRNTFTATESDEITLFIEECDFNKAMSNELILSSIKAMNLRMMNKIAVEDKFRRTPSHCIDLANAVIELI